MPGFSIEISFPVGAVYNIKSDGGTQIKGSADVEVVHSETKESKTEDEEEDEGKNKSLVQYAEYALKRVEGS